MIPKECKRLAEVDFPIADVSRHATREKSIRHGHPSTLHLWWARRPLASSRAMLMALLLPDPCDPHCPEEFRDQARQILLRFPARPARWDTELQTNAGLRQGLLTFIADFANWDNAAKTAYLETGQNLAKAAHPEETPLVVDPFAGGGSIPLEALRLGCDAFASDLNPVACLILKTMLEDIPRHGPGLADELRQVGAEIKAEAEQQLAELYPKDPDGATPIAYLWARTVRCESPHCGAEIPLMSSMWLCRKQKRKWALRPIVSRPEGEPPQVDFEIFAPSSDHEVGDRTVARARATCVCCGAVLPPERTRSQLTAQRGGADAEFDDAGNRTGGARMTAVVTLKPGQPGRHYRLPTDGDYAAVRKALRRIDRILTEWEHDGKHGLCPVPDETIHQDKRGNFWVVNYGATTFGDLFTARQKAVLIILQKLALKTGKDIQELLAIALNRTADGSASISRWLASGEEVKNVFSRQSLPLVWDFGESNYLANASRSWTSAINSIASVIESGLQALAQGAVESADAVDHPLPDQAASVWFTDPPYYDAIAYSGLSDFFYVWLKRTLPGHTLLRNSFEPQNPVTPKYRELIVDAPNDKAGTHTWQFYENGMAKAFAEGRRVLKDNGIGTVIFAHKTTEGWEALLSGLIQGGWTVTASWPIATESGAKPKAMNTASLITSIHLVCRPRAVAEPVGDWANVLQELPIRVGEWMERLQGEGVRGADLVFACVGPALEIFSRYPRVETAAGDEVGLPEYLEKVWEVVGRAALEQVLGTPEAQARNGTAGALEEDARLTALFLWTLQSAVDSATDDLSDDRADDEREHDGDDDADAPRRREKGYQMPFDVARRFAQPLGIHLDEWNSRIVDIKKGVVRLLPVTERGEQLFGTDGASALADQIEASNTKSLQLSLFPEPTAPNQRQKRRGRNSAKSNLSSELTTQRDATTLDRVHAAMLFQHSGRSQALRALIQSEQEKGPDFLRLANALSALYPRGSQEKRLLDAMLLAVPR
jgi:putative DNA methylase